MWYISTNVFKKNNSGKKRLGKSQQIDRQI